VLVCFIPEFFPQLLIALVAGFSIATHHFLYFVIHPGFFIVLSGYIHAHGRCSLIDLPAAGGGATTALAFSAGKQLGNRTFVSLNAGFCPSSLSSFDYRNLGVGVEYRFSRHWKGQLVMEPALRYCGQTSLGSSLTSATLYQFGADFLWEKEF